MTAPLREQLQMARINRVKRRVHDWWHRERCEVCAAQRAATANLGAFASALVQGARAEFIATLPVREDEPQKH